MDDQLTFEDLEAVAKPIATPSRPQCSICKSPVAWQPRNRRWSQYCGSNTCISQTRPCKHCGEPFVKNHGEAGTKYCSLECKRKGYTEGLAARDRPRAQCAWCNEWGESSRWVTKWPYICERCLDPISHVVRRLKAHNVSHERARKLTVDPGCEVCGRDMLQWARPVRTGSKSMEPMLTVDHDHGCCPGDTSCGACVRGLLCMRCNTALGMLHDDLAAAQALAEYLQRHAP